MGRKCNYCDQSNYSTLNCKGVKKSVNLVNKDTDIAPKKLKTNYKAKDNEY